MAKTADLPMVDMVFAVDDPVAWHIENMERNPTHYTPLFPLPARLIAYFQESFGASIWFNALVRMNIQRYPDRLMKYGVISTRAMVQDLLHWNHLYVAGRLHKPVRVFQTNPIIDQAIATNREHALRASLLLLPNWFPEIDLYYTIASLSYVGDPRMIIGENPKKVLNLVNPIVPHYRALYLNTLLGMAEKNEVALKMIPSGPAREGEGHNYTSSSASAGVFIHDHTKENRWKLCQRLPLNMRRVLLIQGRARYWRQTPPKHTAIRTALASVVAQAATSQSIKGLLTVGAVKVGSYLLSKVTKQFMAKGSSRSSSTVASSSSSSGSGSGNGSFSSSRSFSTPSSGSFSSSRSFSTPSSGSFSSS
jgi:translocator assembly and maintenance protein 41